VDDISEIVEEHLTNGRPVDFPRNPWQPLIGSTC
jgi:(2Fe-2S) ferredoxin